MKSSWFKLLYGFYPLDLDSYRTGAVSGARRQTLHVIWKLVVWGFGLKGSTDSLPWKMGHGQSMACSGVVIDESIICDGL